MKTYVKLDRKKIPLFKFQEELARNIVKQLMRGNCTIYITVGVGRRIIMQRVADLLKDI